LPAELGCLILLLQLLFQVLCVPRPDLIDLLPL